MKPRKVTPADPRHLMYQEAEGAAFQGTATMRQLAIVLLGEGGALDREEYTVELIKRYLMPEALWALFAERHISIEDVLNGRVEGDDQQQLYDHIFHVWNSQLGRRAFGLAGPFGEPYGVTP